MKSMDILIDTNVLINYLTNREDPFLEESIQIMKLCACDAIHGYYAFHSLSTIWYVLRKWPDSRKRDALQGLCSILSSVAPDNHAIMDAIHDDSVADFEDCLQIKCAEAAGVDAIVTCNIGDFKNSSLMAVTPAELLKLLA